MNHRLSSHFSLIPTLLILVLLCLATFLRLYRLDGQSLWADEGNSVAMVSRVPLEIIQRTANDIHPPLYYLTLSAYARVTGTSVIAVRGLSVLFGVVTVGLTMLLALCIGGWRVAFFAGLAGTFSPFAIHYSQETRMYMMVTMLGAASWLLWRQYIVCLSPIRAVWFGYFIINFALLHTHYYAVSVVVAQNLAWLWMTIQKERVRGQRDASEWQRWIAIQAALVLAYLPWLWYAHNTILNWPSISSDITLSFIAGEVFRIFSLGLANDGMPAWVAIGFGLLFVLGFIAALYAPSPANSRQLPFTPLSSRQLLQIPLFYFLVPPALMLLLSLDRPFWNPKFLLLALPGYHLLLGIGAATLMGWLQAKNRLLALLLGVVIAAFLGAAAVEPLHNEYWVPRFWRDDYRAMARLIEAQATEDDAILLDGAGQREVFEYYFDCHIPCYGLPAIQPLDESDTQAQLEQIAAQHERLFVLWWAEEQGDPALFIPHWLDDHAFEAGSRWFGDVRLATYRLGELPTPSALDLSFSLPMASEGEESIALRLAGASFEPQTAISGDVIALNSLWASPNHLDLPITFFAQLLDAGNHVVGQYDGDGGAAPVQEWESGSGETQTIRMGIPIAIGTPPGDYALILGAYRSDNGQRLMMTETITETNASFQLATVRIEAPIVPPTLEALSLQYDEERDISFGDITLVGARANKLGFDHAPDTPLASGTPLSLLLYWRAEQDAPAAMPLMLQLYHQNGTLAAEWSFEPTEGRYPPQNWTKDELIRDPQVRFLPTLEPGDYRLILAGKEVQALVGELAIAIP